VVDRRSTDEMIEMLAARLVPVRRVPRLRAQLAAVAAAWVLTLGAVTASGGGVAREVLTDPAFVAVVLATVVAAFGASAAALAESIPGRAGATQLAVRATAAGLLVLVAAAVRVAAPSDGALIAGPHEWMCAGTASLLAAPAALLLVLWMHWGFALRPRNAAATAGLGALALGAIAAYLRCGAIGPGHWVIGHALLPMLLGAGAGASFALALRRPRDRDLGGDLDASESSPGS
jgi:hypothetical protein